MRPTIFATLVALTFVPPAVTAQDTATARPATLLRGRPAFGGYLDLDTRVSRVKGATGVFSGAAVVLLIDHRFAIGLGGFALVTDDARVDAGSGAPRRLSMGYGGLHLGYVARPASMVHPRVDVLIGGGSVGAGARPTGDESDRVFVVEPAVGLELSIARALRLGVGASYRYVGDVELAGVRAADLRAFSGHVVLRAGKF